MLDSAESNDFGALLRQQRLAAGLTQAALAERAGIAERTVQDLERGAARPRRATVRRLIDALKPSPEIRAQLEATIPTPRQRIGPPIQMLTPYVAQDDRQSNLPIPPTTLLGRERELSEILALVRDGVRLVTLTGPGGVGKTRLGIAVAAELLEDFTDGVFLVELAPISDAALVPSTIAQVLGVRDVGGRPIADAVKNHLRARSVLLLLDNFEQILPAARVVADLLATCPHLKVLATSREPLRVRGEQEYGVPPLTLADARQAPTAEVVLHAPAVALFVQRARAIRADFRLTDESAPTVAEICARLDGLPLAIELAAARVRHLTVEALRSRLASCLQLLTVGARDLPARQQTLRATIDWSYDLLDEDERRLFRRLAVFAGGFTLDAAEAVCNVGDGPEIDVLGGVASLVERSLLRLEQTVGDPRYGLLETLREYGSHQLVATGEAEATRPAHADYYLKLAERAEPALSGAQQARWLERLAREHENFRAALRWAVERGEAETGLRLGGALGRFWFVRGLLSEGRERLLELLALPGSPTECRPRADALNWLAVIVREQGDYERAKILHEQALALRRRLGDTQGVAASLGNLGNLAQVRGDYATARVLHSEALAIRRELGDKHGVTTSLGNLGIIAQLQGEYEKARSLHEEALAIKRELGDMRGIAYSLGNLGIIAQARGDYVTARSVYTDILALGREVGDKRLVAHAFNWLGTISGEQGDVETAQYLHEQALALRHELADKHGVAMSLGNLGLVAYTQGQHRAARSLQEQALVLRHDLGDRRGIASSLEAFAALSLAGRQPASAARLYGAAQALREVLGAPLAPVHVSDHHARVAAVRAELGDQSFEAEWDEGRAMSLEQAIAYALEGSRSV